MALTSPKTPFHLAERGSAIVPGRVERSSAPRPGTDAGPQWQRWWERHRSMPRTGACFSVAGQSAAGSVAAVRASMGVHARHPQRHVMGRGRCAALTGRCAQTLCARGRLDPAASGPQLVAGGRPRACADQASTLHRNLLQQAASARACMHHRARSRCNAGGRPAGQVGHGELNRFRVVLLHREDVRG